MSAPRGFPIDWQPVQAISFAAATSGQLILNRECRLYGWAFLETSGNAAAQLEVFDGTTVNSQSIAPIALLAGQSSRDIWGKPGIEIRTGLFVNISAGSVRGSLYVLGLSADEIIRAAGYVASDS